MTSLYLMFSIGHTARFHNKGSKGMGGAFDPPMQVTINFLHAFHFCKCLASVLSARGKLALDNHIMCVSIVHYMIYGHEGCGREAHTARGAAECCTSCCMGLSTTPLVPVNHVMNSKCTLSAYVQTHK